jgi:hypothetical protein
MDGLFTKDAALYLGRVISNDDNVGGNRIKATIYPADKRKTAREIPYAFPLIPKMVHIVPKVGEMVIIICDDMNNPNSQRYYLGPIISQPQFLFHEGSISATSLLKGGVMPELPSPASYASMHGAFPKVDEIAILGRKNSDIILSDNDLRIRCGVRLVDENNNKNIIFNKESPSYIKLKHYPVRLQEGAESTATIVADKINLISNVGEPYFNVVDTNEGISDEEMREIIEKAHRLPYGDVLVNFLSLLLKMFKSHTHKYHNMPPCPDTNSSIFDAKYSSDENNLQQQLLSDNVRIN